MEGFEHTRIRPGLCTTVFDDCHLFVVMQITADARARFINPSSYILSSLRLAGASYVKALLADPSDVSGYAYKRHLLLAM